MKKKNRIRLILFSVLGLFLLVTISCTKDDNTTPVNIVKDIDGNTYHTVTIGTQVWMVENLNTTKYRDGTNIPNFLDNPTLQTSQSSAYCDYDITPSNSKIYGRLYNQYSLSSVHNIAPVGWHVPSNKEWTTLFNYLGGNSVAGGKLKEAEYKHWFTPNSDATNISGFTALPGGFGTVSFSSYPIPYSFYNMGFNGFYWSSDEFNSLYGTVNILTNTNNRVIISTDFRKYNFCSVRCIKDTLTNPLP